MRSRKDPRTGPRHMGRPATYCAFSNKLFEMYIICSLYSGRPECEAMTRKSGLLSAAKKCYAVGAAAIRVIEHHQPHAKNKKITPITMLVIKLVAKPPIRTTTMV